MSRILSENSDCYIRRRGLIVDSPSRACSKELITTSSTETTCSVSEISSKNAESLPLAECELSDDDLFYIWKRNSPLLYDTLLLHKLDWPSLTVCKFKFRLT